MECGPEVRTLREGSEQSSTQTERFQKTRGFATTSGQDYEVALCCLFFLRAVRLTSDFFLVCNHALAGKFDDVVLFYRLKTDECLKYRAILLQAKHKDKTTDKKLTTSNPFRLKEYLDSFRDIRNLWEQSVKVQNKLIEFLEISLVLYTNTGCAIGDTAHDVTDYSDLKHLRYFLNTGGRLLRISDAQRVGLPQEQETTDFFGHLILCIEQMSVETADQFLEEEISNVLGLVSFNVAKKLKSELKHMVKNWWKEEGEGRFLSAQSEEWKKILEMQVTRLNNDTLFVDRQLNVDFAEAALEDLKSVINRKQSWVFVKDKYQATMTRVRLLKALRSCLILDAKFLECQFDEVEALWGTAVCPTLVLDISANSPDELYLLLQRPQMAVRSHAGRHLVIISEEKPTKEEWFVLEAEATWSILDPATQERLLSVQVDFQGYVLALCDVVGLNAPYVMSDKIINSLCDPAKEAAKLGLSIPTSLEYYVPQCMQRVSSKTIKFDTLKNTKTLIFPKNILPFNYGDISRFKTLYSSDLKRTNQIARTVFIKGVRFDSEIRNLCCRFCVRGVSGDVAQQGLENKVTEFLPFTWICEEKFVVVEGVPGVGKSYFVTAMCSRVKERFPESWVLRVDMGKQIQFINESDFRKTSDIKTFLMRSLSKNFHCLERDLLEHSLYVTGNVFLFLDAYDEISPDFTAKCCDLLKGIATTVRFRQMVVTTRPITSKEVEEALGTKAFNLPVFSEDEQSLFLERFCKAKGKNFDEEEISSLRHSAGPVLQIPLLCKMAAEVLLYRDDQILLTYMNPWRKVLLYQLFVEQSINNRLAEKLGLDVSMPGVKKLLESNTEKHCQNLQTLAVRKLMPINQLPTLYLSTKLPEEKFGLVVDNGESVDFEHQTFAEYFLGRWLARHWQECHEQLLRELCSHDDFVAATLSWSLFEGSPLHLAVAQGDEVAVRQLLSSETTDRGGRTAIHVAAMTQGKQHEVVELLVASGEDPNKKDDIFLSNAVTYAEMFRNWEFVDVMLKTGKTLDGLKIFTDQTVAKDVIIQIIKEDLTCLCKYILQHHKGIFQHKFDVKGNSLLHIAVVNNSIGVAKVLIELRQDVNFQNSDGETPLHETSRFGHEESVRLLLDNGVHTNIKTKHGDTALMRAAREGHLEIVKLLRENRADPNIISRNGDTALMLAAGQGHLEVVKQLIEFGADPKIKKNNGYTALIMAARVGALEVVKLLVENGADPNIKTGCGDTALIMAAREGHVNVVHLLIENGADGNVKSRNGVTALMLASREGHIEVVQLLIESGVNQNITNNYGNTALILATTQGHAEIVKVLIENETDPNIWAENGNTALTVAGYEGQAEVVKLLIENETHPNIKSDYGDTALWQTTFHGHTEVAKLLIENGANPNIKFKHGNTALMRAASWSHDEVVKLLIENGADPNIKNDYDNTALMLAGNAEVVKLLIKKGEDPKIKKNNDNMVLMMAAGKGDVEEVKLLMENGADPNIKTSCGAHAMLLAARHGHADVVKLLIENGVDPNIKNKYGKMPCLLAACHGHAEVLKLLMNNGANPNKRTNYGNTALALAAGQGHAEIVKLLIQNGADPNIKNSCGDTALMWAARNGHAEIVKLLIENGANLHIQNSRGDTTLLLAARHGHAKVVKVLLENGTDINIKTKYGNTALILAANRGHVEVVKILIENGADPNIKTKYGSMALILSAGQGRAEVVKLLIENGADLNLKISCGNTPLMLAAYHGHAEVVKLLIENGTDINIRAKYSITALMMAVSQGHVEVFKLLIENGADPNIKTEYGETALMMAASKCRLEIWKLLREKKSQ